MLLNPPNPSKLVYAFKKMVYFCGHVAKLKVVVELRRGILGTWNWNNRKTQYMIYCDIMVGRE